MAATRFTKRGGQKRRNAAFCLRARHFQPDARAINLAVKVWLYISEQHEPIKVCGTDEGVLRSGRPRRRNPATGSCYVRQTPHLIRGRGWIGVSLIAVRSTSDLLLYQFGVRATLR